MVAVLAMSVAPVSWADVGKEMDDNDVSSPVEPIPDMRDDDQKLKPEKRNWVVVPIPTSDPTLDTGLVLGGAYFYPQTEEQKKVQPPSVTIAAGFRTSNKSSAFGIAHQSYLSEDTWRIGGVFAHIDIKSDVRTPGAGGSGPSVDWLVEGGFLAARVSRKVAGNWYVGVFGRYVNMDQTLVISGPSVEFNTDAEIVSVGLGINMEYDNRDTPFNSYTGNRFKVSVLANSKGLGSDDTYQSYNASYTSYHSVSPSVVLAWEAQACGKSDKPPLWDACRVDLRGFSALEYLGRTSASLQVEARWRSHGKWGAVAFVGGGYYKNAFSEIRDRKLIPSYGVGLRFMVLESQRINMRLDYGRSNGSDAVYLSAGEAF
jgi:hypothetical protein